MAWIFLSPHADDVALSCGGLVWELARSGQPTSVWTVCAGDPPQGELSDFAKALHARWETGRQATRERRREDAASCREMEANYRPMDIPDCIYRRSADNGWLYPKVNDIFGQVHPEDVGLIVKLTEELMAGLSGDDQVVCPLAVGSHVDHQITRRVAERLGMPLWYYADYPYVLQYPEQLASLTDPGWAQRIFSVSQAGLEAWGRSVAAHASQINTFWPDLDAMRGALRAYWQPFEGVRLWRREGADSRASGSEAARSLTA